jgi:hypothetical protein
MIFIHIKFHENLATGPKFDVVERKTYTHAHINSTVLSYNLLFSCVEGI